MFKLLVRKSPHDIILTSTEIVDKTSHDAARKSPPENVKLDKESTNSGNLTPRVSDDALVSEQKEASIPCEQSFRVLTQLVKILQAQVVVARKSLLHAAFEAPIHGVLYCMREIICDFDLK